MKILLSDITDEGLDLAFEETPASDALKLQSPVRVALRITKAGTEVLAEGTAAASIELQCSRCLKGFVKALDVQINAVYHPVEELKGEEKHEIKDDELDMGFYRGDELDIQDLVVEQMLLNVPMKPLCSESCRGICPTCGADLNVSTCGCERKEQDPRLAVLKKLLADGKE